jgi:subtilisin-like proprotein convertase family protein
MITHRRIFSIALVAVALLASNTLRAQYRYEGGTGPIGDAIASGSGSIPNTTQFPVTVSGFVGEIVEVRLLLYIVHPADQELSITLTSAGSAAVVVPILQNREDVNGNIDSGVGATGANFGTGCTDTARTTFEDGVGAQIPSGTAPYVGTFIPEYPFKLGALDGKSGNGVNGTWFLTITDYHAGNMGTLMCWSLLLDSTDLIFRNGFELD